MHEQLKSISEESVKSFIDFIKTEAAITRAYSKRFPINSYKRNKYQAEARTLEDLITNMINGDIGIAQWTRNHY